MRKRDEVLLPTGYFDCDHLVRPNAAIRWQSHGVCPLLMTANISFELNFTPLMPSNGILRNCQS
jgi:hypothetical protein